MKYGHNKNAAVLKAFCMDESGLCKYSQYKYAPWYYKLPTNHLQLYL